MSKQSRSSRLTKQRSRSQSPEDMARSDNGCGDDDDDNIDVDDGDDSDDSDDVRIRSSINGGHLNNNSFQITAQLYLAAHIPQKLPLPGTY